MLKACVLVLAIIAQDCSSQDDEGIYRGKLIGKFNSYHHQVSGDVYAVDDYTILLVDFNYDGTGDDTFFWAGDSGRPGPQGFIIPDQHGKTNVLERYYNAEVRLRLPEGKRVSRLKWVAVYDINSQNAFADVDVADDFEAPAAAAAAPLVGPGVSSGPVRILDASTILIPELHYGGGGAVWWAGAGAQPSSRGVQLFDDHGYLEAARARAGEDVRLQLPGALTVFRIRWLALYHPRDKQIVASVLLPEAANVPASPRAPHPFRSQLPHCRQLHRRLQVAWEVFGSQVTIQLAGQISESEYMAFGISAERQHSRMVGADVAVARFDAARAQGFAADYNISDLAPCVSVLGAWRGVCRDELVGGSDSTQLLAAARDAGLTLVTYRRSLMPAESMDREWATDGPAAVVWAIGPADAEGAPAYHSHYPREDVLLDLGRKHPDNDCVPFTVGEEPGAGAWETAQLFDPAVRVFRVSVGPAGAGGRAGRGRGAGGLALYVNGQLAPDLQLRRGLHYSFEVRGGNDPHSARWYHPVVITATARGGLEQLPEARQRAARVLAGARTTRRARLAPTAAGPLCRASLSPAADPRRAGDFPSFRAFNRSLAWECPPAAPALLPLAPNASWPDLVYYNSFTHADMGGRIFIVDRHKRSLGRASAAAPVTSHPLPLLPLTSLALAAAALLAAGRS